MQEENARVLLIFASHLACDVSLYPRDWGVPRPYRHPKKCWFLLYLTSLLTVESHQIPLAFRHSPSSQKQILAVPRVWQHIPDLQGRIPGFSRD